MRDATKAHIAKGYNQIISIHASHAGCDLHGAVQGGNASYFNPRIPCGMRLPDDESEEDDDYYFNPRIPCGMRPVPFLLFLSSIYFNPRIPCGMRRRIHTFRNFFCYFNPRIPCGMRPFRTVMAITLRLFQSTHPMRDATIEKLQMNSLVMLFQSTHPMRDATSISILLYLLHSISIHASHAGCDARLECFYISQ